MTETNFLNHLADQIPWSSNSDPIWPSSLFFLRRNIASFLFPSKLEEKEATHLSFLLKEALSSTSLLKDSLFFSAPELAPRDKELIFEHFLTSDPLAQPHKGQALILDKSATFLGLINAQDHLSLYWSCSGETAWSLTSKKLLDLSNEIAQKMPFAFSSRFGYLTTEYRHIGTALTARALLHLPGLIHTQKLSPLESEIQDLGNRLIGLEENSTALIGDIVLLENRYKIGLSEEELMRNVYSQAKKLSDLERVCRDEIRAQKPASFKDLISRAFGLLTHSYEIEAKETLNALSLLKLGLHLGWIEGLSDYEIFELMFLTRRAHLLQKYRLEIPTEEVPHKRSEFLHEKLKTCSLKIP